MRDEQSPITERHHDRFIDREGEFARLLARLTGAAPMGLLVLLGPPGIGKTTLLREFERSCSELGVPWAAVDVATVTDPEDLARLAWAQLAGGGTTLAELFAQPHRQVLLLDHYTPNGVLDASLRQAQLGGSGETLVVLAMRQNPPPAWFNDPEWGALLEEAPLRPFSQAASQRYLELCGVRPELLAPAAAVACGHPLSLSLLARRLAASSEGLSTAVIIDTARTVLDLVLAGENDPERLMVLEMAALSGALTESVLRARLPDSDTKSLFRWLCSFPIVRIVSRGLVVLEPFATFLIALVKWRDPEYYTELREGLQEVTLSFLQGQRHVVRLPQVVRLLALADSDGTLRRALLSGLVDGLEVTGLHRQELPHALHFLGSEELRATVTEWIENLPAVLRGIRDPAGHLLAWIALLPIDGSAGPSPYGMTVVQRLGGVMKLRPGEQAVLHLTSLAPGIGDRAQACLLLALASHLERLLALPNVAVSIFLSDTAEWQECYREILQSYGLLGDEKLLRGVSERLGSLGPASQSLLLALRDWRWQSVLDWFSTAGQERRITGTGLAVEVMDRETFITAVQQALREWSRPERLRGDPLLQSRIVTRLSGGTASERQRIEVLRTLLERAIFELGLRPQYRRWQQVAETAWLRPVEAQERMAEQLGIPFSTYRRYLKYATTWIAEFCWQLEVEGEDTPVAWSTSPLGNVTGVSEVR